MKRVEMDMAKVEVHVQEDHLLTESNSENSSTWRWGITALTWDTQRLPSHLRMPPPQPPSTPCLDCISAKNAMPSGVIPARQPRLPAITAPVAFSTCQAQTSGRTRTGQSIGRNAMQILGCRGFAAGPTEG